MQKMENVVGRRRAITVAVAIVLLGVLLLGGLGALPAYASGLPPVAYDQSVSGPMDTPIRMVLSANDPEGDPLEYMILMPPRSGFLLERPPYLSPSLTYQPFPGFSGQDEMVWMAFDGEQMSNPAWVTITVGGSPPPPVPNNPPVATDDTAETNEDTPISINVLANDSDPDGDSLVVASVTPGTYGSAVIDPRTGMVTYTQMPDYHMADLFTYTVSDGRGGSATGVVRVNVLPVNDIPVAQDANVTVVVGSPKSVVLTASDADGDVLTYSVVTLPAHGTLSGAAPNLTYTPDAGYTGPDQLTYKANDGVADSNVATVYVTVYPEVPAPQAGDTIRASLATDGTESDGDSEYPAISADGRYVAFQSRAWTLSSEDDKYMTDIFVRDLETGTTEFISRSSGGAAGNNDSLEPSISADGRYVAFMSLATNLVPNDERYIRFHVYVRDRLLGTTARVSESDADTPGYSDSYEPHISADGRYVAFWSHAYNLVPDDTNSSPDVFVRDLQQGTTERVSIAHDGAQASGPSGAPYTTDPNQPRVSADGRYVAFYSKATNLVPGDTNGQGDIFVRDRVVGSTIRANVSGSGAQGENYYNCAEGYFDMSPDGRYVAFISGAANLVPVDSNGRRDTFVRDTVSRTTERVSLSSAGAEQVGGSEWAVGISADGRYVAFGSDSSNLVDGDTNGSDDIFLRDRVNGTMRRVSVSSGEAQGNSWSEWCDLSGDGSRATFISDASNLVDGDTNGCVDVFVHQSASGEPQNTPPTADGQAVSTDEDTPADIVLTGSDADGDPLTYAVVDAPAHGNLSGTAPNLAYTPAADYNGPDGFTFKVNDGTVDSNAVTVTIEVRPVNDDPVAADDSVQATEDTPKTVDVLANDRDVDGDKPCVVAVTQGANGTVEINGDGTLTYIPEPNYNKGDSFTYTVDDGHGGSATATVTVAITPVNDAPVLAAIADISMDEDSARDVAITATDVDGNSLVISAVGLPGFASFEDSPDGSGSGMLALTPGFSDAGTHGPVAFTVSDGELSDSKTMSITVNNVNRPPVADDLARSTEEDTSIDIELTGSDPDGEALTACLLLGATHGAVIPGILPNHVTYIPQPDYNGLDSFTFVVADPHGATDDGRVDIVVNSVNDAASAYDDAAATDEDIPVVVRVLANDVDPEGDMLRVTSAGQGQHGSTAVNSDGTITYVPEADFNGTDEFSYQVADASGKADTAVVTVTVNPVNDPPHADAGPDQNVDERTVVTLHGAGSDIDADQLTYAWVQVAGPEVVLSDPAAASPTFTAPEVLADTPITFELTVSDGVAGASDQVTVNVRNVVETGYERARTIGYWKNHPEQLQRMLDLGEIDLGDTNVTGLSQAIAILSSANSKDARYMLRAQLLATCLNLRNNANPLTLGYDIRAVVGDAKAFLAAHPNAVTSTSPDRARAIALKDKLDAYNNSGE